MIRTFTLYFSFMIILLSSLAAVSQDTLFNSPINEPLSARKLFWKKVYSEIDSSHTVIYNRSTLAVYSIVESARASAVIDSITGGVSNPSIFVKQGRREFIAAAIKRAGHYPFIDDTLKKYQLHPGLKWLPVLESGYLDTMVSARGARGIWQFMPATGKKYGLSTHTITDPALATSAFARYFTALITEFNDYPLALAAYNHGEGGIRAKLKKRNGKTLDDIIPLLGFESRNYYARFLAILDIVRSTNSGKTIHRADTTFH